jgi:hypothetical protein
MVDLGSATHVLDRSRMGKSWVAGPRPAMTQGKGAGHDMWWQPKAAMTEGLGGRHHPSIDPVSMNRWCQDSASPGSIGACWP